MTSCVKYFFLKSVAVGIGSSLMPFPSPSAGCKVGRTVQVLRSLSDAKSRRYPAGGGADHMKISPTLCPNSVIKFSTKSAGVMP